MNRDIDPYEVAENLLGWPGAMLSGSKTANPERRVIWNSNVCAGKTKIWFGDISLTESEGKLQQLADKLDETIYVLYESDGRFEFEHDPRLDRAVVKIEPSTPGAFGPGFVYNPAVFG